MPLQDLQQTIDHSVATASGFSRELFTAEPWTAKQVQDYTNEKGFISVATIGADGWPHSVIVAAGCVDGSLYIGVTPRTALLGNLRRSDRVAFTIGNTVTGRGTATFAGMAGDLKGLAASLPAILRSVIEQDGRAYFYTIQPSRLLATGPGN